MIKTDNSTDASVDGDSALRNQTPPLKSESVQSSNNLDAAIVIEKTGVFRHFKTWLNLIIILLLPVIYLAVTGIVAYATFFHGLFGLNYNVSSFPIVKVILYILPLISGSLFVLLLLRPLLPLRAKEKVIISNHEYDSTALYQFTSEICTQLCIQKPVETTLTIEPIIVAHSTGLENLLKNRLSVTVGLPLLSCLTLNQLSTLIAHTCYLYSNRNSSYIYQALSWLEDVFAKCINGGDGWRSYFLKIEENSNTSIVIIFALLGKAGVWTSDQLLIALYSITRLLTKNTVISIKNHADKNAINVAGKEIFYEALKFSADCETAFNDALKKSLLLPTNNLVDNFVLMVQKQIAVENDDKSINQETTRIQPVWRLIPGIWQQAYLDGFQPSGNITFSNDNASTLIPEFQSICEKLTPQFYHQLGLDYQLQDLKHVVLNDKQYLLEQDLLEKLNEYTSSTFLSTFVWNTNDFVKISKYSDTEKQTLIIKSISQFRNKLPNYQEALIRYPICRKENIELCISEQMCKNGYTSSDLTDHESGNSKQAKNGLDCYRSSIDSYCRVAGIRVISAIMLLQDKHELEDGIQYLGLLLKLQSIQVAVLDGLKAYEIINGLTERMLKYSEFGYQKTIEKLAIELAEINRSVRAALITLPGSLKDVKDMSTYIQTEIKTQSPASDQVKLSYDEFQVLYSCFLELNQIISGKIANLAITSERVRGIDPVRLIPQPAKQDAA